MKEQSPNGIPVTPRADREATDADGRERGRSRRLMRLFAALSETNEAIMRATTRAELFALVCEAAVKGGPFSSTVIALADPGAGEMRIAATAGQNARLAQTLKLATTPDSPYGRGVAGEAFRSRRTCVSNDYLADGRTQAFHGKARQGGGRACAALPLINRGAAIGVMLLVSQSRGAFTEELVRLLERLAANVSFALENFDREEERLLAEVQRQRTTQMYTALSATNEAIMRAGTREELFGLVCRAALSGGNFVKVVVSLPEPGMSFLRDAACAEVGVTSEAMMIPLDQASPGGRGLSATAFLTGRPCISNDYLADPRGAAFHQEAIRVGVGSLAAIPLLDGDRTFGVIVFMARGVDAFALDLVELFERLAANVAFALKNFERADERRLAGEQKESLTRMFAALSATNEAIIRASSRDELFDLVCRAAVHGGRFASTIIALREPESDFLRVVAWAGPTGEKQKSVRIAVKDSYPEGRGISGRAFRTLQPCIVNDYLADGECVAFHARAIKEGNQGGAALPLIVDGKAAGVLVFMSSERHALTPELVELLSRLAGNLSFALENFARAEEKARADERIKYLATHDGLTGLPNRAKFNLLLRETIEAGRRDGERFAVLFIDVDRFKVINDSLGHDAGDALLVETAGRLQKCLSLDDVVARLGGDEFVVILRDCADVRRIEEAARRILAAISDPVQLQGVECRATASIGIAVFPSDGEDEGALTKNADMAMYSAKEEGKNGFRFYALQQHRSLSVERLVFEARLRQALERGELWLAYQPKVQAATNRVTGVEALLRWTLPDLGTLPPLQFIPIAEETGLIVPIGRWVLKTACAQNVAWMKRGLPQLSMAVNLSPRQFSDENLLADIDDALASSGLPPELLQLEITESMVMHNVGRAIELLQVIRARGVRLAIDDFGTGYSSMSLMKKLPIDTLKIDRSFVQDLPDDAEDRAIAQAIVSMGRALGLTVVAEGVETEPQAAFLRTHECDEMQGYLFSPPVTAAAVPALVDAAPGGRRPGRALARQGGAGRAAAGVGRN
jgi:diguanylate cyclase (GGDEF)-like protein